jgi:voltage-gated potassium channel Kch
VFLLLFASAYFVMARASPASFSHHLTRTDALYFTVTTFSTVGYGDITPVSQTARLAVTAQMILDLLALGLGIRVFIGAVQLARRARPDPAGPAASPGQPPQQPG